MYSAPRDKHSSLVGQFVSYDEASDLPYDLTLVNYGTTTLSIMTLSIVTLTITTLSIVTLNITTLSITKFSMVTLSIVTLCIMTLSIMTLSIMTLSIMTLSIMTLNIVVQFCHAECPVCRVLCRLSVVNKPFMLSVTM